MNKYKKKDFGYYLLQVVKYPLKWYLHLKFNIKVTENEAIEDEGPFLVIGNHVMNYDPLFTLVYMKPMVRFVAAQINFDNWFKGFIFKLARIIPINKKTSDLKTIRRLLKEVKHGNAVGLYPEGGRTWDGETDDIIYSTAKLVKMLKVRVYNQMLSGAYLSTPRWCKSTRKGELHIRYYKMLEPEDIEQMTEDEIFDVLKKHLSHNDYVFQRKEMIPYKGTDYAMYVERLLYVCPNCQTTNSFYSDKDIFTCRACDSKGTMDEYAFIKGDFPYDNLVDFNHYQRDYLPSYLKTNEIEHFIENVTYKRFENGEKKKQLVNLIIQSDQIIIDFFGEKEIYGIKKVSPITLTFANTLTFYANNVRHEFVVEPFLHNISIMYLHDTLNYLRGDRHAD